MRRNTPKRARDDRQDAIAVNLWQAEQSRCAVCWKPGAIGNGLETHHLAGRSGAERNNRANLLALCGPAGCHAELHRGRLTRGHCLTAKLEEAPEEFDKTILCRISGRAATSAQLSPEPLPQWVLGLRTKHWCRA